MDGKYKKQQQMPPLTKKKKKKGLQFVGGGSKVM